MHTRKPGTVPYQVDISHEFLFDLILVIFNRRIGNSQMIPQRFRQIFICLICQLLLTLPFLLISHLRNGRAIVYDIVV